MKLTIPTLTLALLAFTLHPLAAADAEAGPEAKKFLKKAAQGGMFEVKLGTVAADKAENADVKAFGKMMVEDHSKANEKLTALAGEKGVKVPEALDAKHQKTLDQLSGLSGSAFDKAYVKEMVEDHQKDVAEFKEASDQQKDAEVKAFAAKTLPVLEKHLAKIQEIQGKM